MKKRTMKAAAMFLTLLFLMLVPVTAYGDTAYVVTGTTNYLALRTEPRTDSRNEIGKLHNGDTFYVTSRSGGYAYGYTVLGIYGYVNANYLTAINYQPQPVQPQPQSQTQPAVPSSGYIIVPAPGYQPQPAQPQPVPQQPVGTLKTVTGTKNYLALRKAAVRSDSNEIGRLYNGNPFYVLRWENNGFAYGYTAAGQYGYVVSAYLK